MSFTPSSFATLWGPLLTQKPEAGVGTSLNSLMRFWNPTTMFGVLFGPILQTEKDLKSTFAYHSTEWPLHLAFIPALFQAQMHLGGPLLAPPPTPSECRLGELHDHWSITCSRLIPAIDCGGLHPNQSARRRFGIFPGNSRLCHRVKIQKVQVGGSELTRKKKKRPLRCRFFNSLKPR